MSEVKRYDVTARLPLEGTEELLLVDVKMVFASEYDAAQVELAALREELEAESKGADKVAEDLLRLNRLLTAAEQRNATISDLLLRTLAYYTESCFPEDLLIEVKVALGMIKPTESGASE